MESTNPILPALLLLDAAPMLAPVALRAQMSKGELSEPLEPFL